VLHGCGNDSIGDPFCDFSLVAQCGIGAATKILMLAACASPVAGKARSALNSTPRREVA
jgi:hypothetical protein